METLLLLAHTEADGSLGTAALESLAAAKSAGAALPDSKLLIGLIGSTVQPGADQVAGCGAEKFLAAVGAEFACSRYSTDAAAAEALCRAAGATIVLAPATARFNRFLAGVAQRVGGRIDTHVTGITATNGQLSANRWYYRQRMEAVLQSTRRPWFILLEPGSQKPWAVQPGAAKVEQVQVNLPESCLRTNVTGMKEPAADAQTIRPEANLLFVAGAGWTKKQADSQPHTKDAEKLILDYLKLARASLGSSKSLVDLSGEGQAVLPFLTHLNQVGQTGSTPRHNKGLATCCHGEEPHTVGWRFINERRAVNLDPNCGWARGKADVLYVADAFAVMAKVNELLRGQSRGLV
jgi:electron transfer flavoprotein alpha subunit